MLTSRSAAAAASRSSASGIPHARRPSSVTRADVPSKPKARITRRKKAALADSSNGAGFPAASVQAAAAICSTK